MTLLRLIHLQTVNMPSYAASVRMQQIALWRLEEEWRELAWWMAPRVRA